MKAELLKQSIRDGRTVIEYQIQQGEMMDGLVLKQCKEGTLSGILPMGAAYEDGHNYMYAYVDDRESMDQALKDVVTRKQILVSFENIVSAMAQMEEKGINLNYVVLDTRYIYQKEQAGVEIICMPGKLAAELDTDMITAFFRNILANAVYLNSEDGDYVAKLLSALNREFELKSFLRQIHGLMMDAGISIEEEKPAPVAEPEPVAVEPAPVVEPEPVAVEPTPVVEPEPVAVEPTPVVEPEPVAVEVAPVVEPEPVAVEPTPVVEPEPVAVEVAPVVEPEPVAVEVAPVVEPEPVAVEPTPVAVEPTPVVEPEPVAVEPAPVVEPTPIADEAPTEVPLTVQAAPVGNVTPVAPAQVAPTGVIQEDEIEFEPMPEEMSAKIERMNGQTAGLQSPEAQQPTMPQPAAPQQPIMQAVPHPHLVRVKTGETISLTGDIFVIGKSQTGVDYTITGNSAISRVHCTIIRHNGAYYIRDEHSTNATYVNGDQVLPGNQVLLTNNCKVHMADEEFLYSLW